MNTQRFLSLVNNSNPSECWAWKGSINSKGQGRFFDGEQWQSAHRLMWQFAKGEIPEDFSVQRTCNNLLCVNPGHLQLGHSGKKPVSAAHLTARFWEKVDKAGGCWLWVGHLNQEGYGIFGGNKLAHRIAWTLFGCVAKTLVSRW